MTQRSHITQVLQNYFDITDVRTRYNSTTIEAQMLNLAGVELENLRLRIGREWNQTLQTVPIGIDNKGVYYSSTVPSAFQAGVDQETYTNKLPFTNVVAMKGAIKTTLKEYDDTLPIPSRIEVDTTTAVVPLANPILFTLEGVGDDLTQTYAVQYVNSETFPIPNVLTLWLDQVGANRISVTLTIVGKIYSQSPWVEEQKNTTEVIILTSEGAVATRNRWTSISTIAVRNLPIGVRLRGWSMPFNLPADPDPGRPYTKPSDRDILYNRYWQISNANSLLYEMYDVGLLTGLTPVNSYQVFDTIVDVAVEPYTSGMYVASDDTLYYADRREYQADLSETGLRVEPLYGLSVISDITKTGSTRYVILSGVPYANYANIYNYRYTVLSADSLRILHSILPNGALGPADAGWRVGAPQSVSFALINSGDYEFSLEMQDVNGATYYDVVPYRNAALVPLATISTSSLIDNIRGLAFDSFGQLWVWNGSYAIPLKIHYDGYIFDDDTNTIYVTEDYDSLQIS